MEFKNQPAKGPVAPFSSPRGNLLAGSALHFRTSTTRFTLRRTRSCRRVVGPGICWAFQTSYASNWHPLTGSHMLDYEPDRLAARGHHLTNVFLHLANTLLLLAFRRATARLAQRPGAVCLAPAACGIGGRGVGKEGCPEHVLRLLALLAYGFYAERRARGATCSFSGFRLSLPAADAGHPAGLAAAARLLAAGTKRARRRAAGGGARRRPVPAVAAAGLGKGAVLRVVSGFVRRHVPGAETRRRGGLPDPYSPRGARGQCGDRLRRLFVADVLAAGAGRFLSASCIRRAPKCWRRCWCCSPCRAGVFRPPPRRSWAG